MKIWLLKLWTALQGKKTNIGAMAVLFLTFALVYLGKLTPTTAYAVALCALSYFALTFRSALATHSAQVLGLFADVLALGIAQRNHNKAGQGAAALALVEDGALVVEGIAQQSQAATTPVTEVAK